MSEKLPKPQSGGLYRRKSDGSLERVSKHQLVYQIKTVAPEPDETPDVKPEQE